MGSIMGAILVQSEFYLYIYVINNSFTANYTFLFSVKIVHINIYVHKRVIMAVAGVMVGIYCELL